MVIFVFSLGFSLYTTQQRIKAVTQPIEQLTAGVNRIRAGDYEHRVYLKTGDEFETLGDALNIAADMIRDYHRVIEEDLQNTRKQREDIFNVYRDVIYAVTQGKFRLLNDEESERIKREGVLQEEVRIAAVTDVNAAREAVTAYLQKTGCCSKQHFAHIILSISEAATNVVKHAGNGTMQIRALGRGFRVSFADQVPGMDFDKLPNMIFLQGFSTKLSMGYGFSIIYKYADKINLSTSNQGTYLAMDFYEAEPINNTNGSLERNDYRDIFENLPKPVILFNEGDEVPVLNRAAIELFHGPNAETIPWLTREVTRFTTGCKEKEVFVKELEMDQGSRSFEIELIRIPDAKGTLVFLNDITERMGTERDLQLRN